MRFAISVLSRSAAGFALALSLATSAMAETPIKAPVKALADTVDQVERSIGARVGLALVDTDSDFSWTHRGDERFLMNSTAKVPICATVLSRRDAGTLALSDRLQIDENDLQDYAPVAKENLGAAMSIGDLCLAAIDMSDNTATNLLIERLGGPQAVTEYFKSIGDPASRLDRLEPEMNTFAAGDPRDTTTPTAMAQTLQTLLLGDALTPDSRAWLANWMSRGGVTSALLRKNAPKGWAIFDKSGSGSHSRNIAGVVVPEGRNPWIVAIFISDAKVDFATRDKALQDLSAAVMAVIRD